MADAPLSGVRILDFTLNLPGPYATHILASLGAEVIKVEPPRGDPARYVGNLFELLNRGKKSVVLDLRDPTTRRDAKRLVEQADVLVEGFRPGVMERLGIPYETARDWNPNIIYCSISAFGQDGPRASEPGHDLNLQALAGLCHLERDAGGNPKPTVLPVADLSTSLVAVASITAALRTGGPTYLDVAMSDAIVDWTQIWGEGVDLAGPVPSRWRRLLKPLLRNLDRIKLYAMPHYGLFRARDGWIAMGIVDENHFWKALCDATGLGFARGFKLPVRTALGPVLQPMLAARILTRSRKHWLEVFERAGVPASPVNHRRDALTDPQFVHRGLVRDGTVRAPVPGSRHLTEPAPSLGQHTALYRDAVSS